MKDIELRTKDIYKIKESKIEVIMGWIIWGAVVGFLSGIIGGILIGIVNGIEFGIGVGVTNGIGFVISFGLKMIIFVGFLSGIIALIIIYGWRTKDG